MQSTDNQERRVGGFAKQKDHSYCEELLEEIAKEHPLFRSYTVTTCESQIVHGTNYRMTLVNSELEVKKCKLSIFQSLSKQQVLPLKYREKGEDCFTMLENAKIDTTSV